MDSLLSYVKEDVNLKAWLANRRLINDVSKFRNALLARIAKEDFASVSIPSNIHPYVGELAAISKEAETLATHRQTLQRLRKEMAQAQVRLQKSKRLRKLTYRFVAVLAFLLLVVLSYFISKYK